MLKDKTDVTYPSVIRMESSGFAPFRVSPLEFAPRNSSKNHFLPFQSHTYDLPHEQYNLNVIENGQIFENV